MPSASGREKDGIICPGSNCGCPGLFVSVIPFLASVRIVDFYIMALIVLYLIGADFVVLRLARGSDRDYEVFLCQHPAIFPLRNGFYAPIFVQLLPIAFALDLLGFGAYTSPLEAAGAMSFPPRLRGLQYYAVSRFTSHDWYNGAWRGYRPTIDTTATVAAWSGATVPANGRGITVGLTVNYLAAAQSEDLRAIARVLRRGRSLVYLDVEVQNAAGTLVAKGLVTYKLG
jgi:hypothetical protein